MGASEKPVEKGTQPADNEVVARAIGWLVAVAVVPFLVHRFRRGWSHLSDVGEFYVLMGVLLWGVSTAHRRALGLPSLSLLVMTLSATVLFSFAFHSPGRVRLLDHEASSASARRTIARSRDFWSCHPSRPS